MENKKHGGFKLEKLHILFDPSMGIMWAYANTDCYYHAADFMHWCLWRMESTQDFSKKCLEVGRLNRLYHYGVNNVTLMRFLVRQKLESYGIFKACKAMKDIAYEDYEDTWRECGCRRENDGEIDEDCDCECHPEPESDDIDSDSD